MRWKLVRRFLKRALHSLGNVNVLIVGGLITMSLSQESQLGRVSTVTR